MSSQLFVEAEVALGYARRVDVPSFGDRFRVILELGRGGMADVWLAVARGPAKLNKLVVLKCLRDNVADDPDFVAMFLDEARLAARLNHPNAVQLHEVGEEAGKYFLSMEYLDGQPLHRIVARAVRRGTSFPQPMWQRVLCDALAGLHHAHELRDFDGTPLAVVHRDVTPENVFVTYDGTVKLVDFGIAKAVGRSVETKMGVVKGKIAYMSPEQAAGGMVPIDRRTDIFAVGIMLWETATLKRFWAGKTDLTILHELLHGGFDPSPRSVDPSIPEELDAICRRALARKPEERYATAAELRDDLEKYLQKDPARPSPTALGAWVSDLFDKERVVVRDAIETALSQLRNEAPPTRTVQAQSVKDSALPPFPHSAVPAPPAAPSTRPPPISVAPPKPKSARERLVRVAAITMGIVGLVLVGLGVKHALAPPTPPAPSTVSVRIAVVPDNARFRIDDGPWLQNPYDGAVERVNGPRTLMVEAPNHTTKKIELELNEDRWIRVSLPKAGAKP